MPNFMQIALAAAEDAALRHETPVGAVLVSPTGDILSVQGNKTEELRDPTAHAEMLVIREACTKTNSPRLQDCDLYVTLEPCAMCAAAISFARVRRLYFGAYDPKGGAVDHGARFFGQPTCLHRTEAIGGVNQSESAQLLQRFFQGLR